jgi:hypothetical protein
MLGDKVRLGKKTQPRWPPHFNQPTNHTSSESQSADRGSSQGRAKILRESQ